jgi:hypothetical protein
VAGYFAAKQNAGMQAMHLYDYLDSGNGYKVRLLLAQLAA